MQILTQLPIQQKIQFVKKQIGKILTWEDQGGDGEVDLSAVSRLQAVFQQLEIAQTGRIRSKRDDATENRICLHQIERTVLEGSIKREAGDVVFGGRNERPNFQGIADTQTRLVHQLQLEERRW